MERPVSRALTAAQIAALRALLAERGLALARNPRNRYVDFEVRTAGRSIFTLYTSGKLVSTLREGDAEGAGVAAEIERVAGRAPARPLSTASRGAGESAGASPSADVRWLAGADETGTGELLGRAVVAGALLPVALVPELTAVAGHVETKSSRAASGWERLGEQLIALSGQGLVTVELPISNRLFDAWSKNGLLDLAYVRLVGDLLAAAGPLGLEAGQSLAGVELAIDDYGTGPLLGAAAIAWRRRGARVRLETRADAHHIATRAASIVARSARSREWEGLLASVEDGPIGTGNAGHPQTLSWLRARARAGARVAEGAPARWPRFVKTSFKTVREASGEDETPKRRVPPLTELLDERSVQDFVDGRLDVRRASLLSADGEPLRRFTVNASGALLEPASGPAWELLPLLIGGLVLDERLLRPAALTRLDMLLEREHGLLADWRVLVGPDADTDDPALLALARAHRFGVLTVVRTAEVDPLERAVRHAAALLAPDAGRSRSRSDRLQIRLPD